MSDKDRYI